MDPRTICATRLRYEKGPWLVHFFLWQVAWCTSSRSAWVQLVLPSARSACRSQTPTMCCCACASWPAWLQKCGKSWETMTLSSAFTLWDAHDLCNVSRDKYLFPFHERWEPCSGLRQPECRSIELQIYNSSSGLPELSQSIIRQTRPSEREQRRKRPFFSVITSTISSLVHFINL